MKRWHRQIPKMKVRKRDTKGKEDNGKWCDGVKRRWLEQEMSSKKETKGGGKAKEEGVEKEEEEEKEEEKERRSEIGRCGDECLQNELKEGSGEESEKEEEEEDEEEEIGR